MHKCNPVKSRMDDRSIGLSNKVLRFIEQKARYAHALQSSRAREHHPWTSWLQNENAKDYYAVTPPMDWYMGVNADESLDYMWDGFEKGDVVIGRISSIREHGMSLLLLTLDCGKARDIDKYKIRAWCSISEIPKNTNHEDVLLRFQDRDLVRCVITDIDTDENELVVSMFPPSYWRDKVTFGKIDDDSLPVSYRRKITCEEPYENILCKSVAFANPNNVEYLLSRLKIPEKALVSLMPKLHSKEFPRNDFAEPLRKRQGKKIADSSVKKGIEKFKTNNYTEALHEFNYALEMDSENVDALVARGALYANRSSFTRAIADFEGALKLEHDHKNAKKYLVQVLVERAQQIEGQMSDLQQVREAERCYQKALRLDHNCAEAKKALGEIQLQREKEQEAEDKKRHAQKTSSLSSPETSLHQQEEKYAATTAEKLRKMLKSENITKETLSIRKRNLSFSKTKNTKKRRGRRRKRNKSPSSSESSSSSSSSSGPEKKKRRKRRSSSTTSSSTPSSSSTTSSSSDSSSTLSSSDECSKRSKKRKTNGYKNADKKRSNRSQEKDSKPASRRSSLNRIDSTSSSASRRRNRSDSSRRSLDSHSENSRCHPQVTIRSEEQKHKYRNRDTSGGRRKSTEYVMSKAPNVEHAEKPENRRHSANFSKITKDNFKDIMSEISAFETGNRQKK